MGGWEAPWHWIVLAIIVIALFGYKKLPDAARSVGRSLRIFKTEIKGMTDDDKKRAEAAAAQPETPRQLETPPQQVPPVPPVAAPVAQPVTPPVTQPLPPQPTPPVTPGTASGTSDHPTPDVAPDSVPSATPSTDR